MGRKRLSEQRARAVTRELLTFRGWDVRAVPSGGQILEENEYRTYPSLEALFTGKSKRGPGSGKPDFLVVDSATSLRPLIVIDTKPSVAQLKSSIADTNHYGDALAERDHDVLCVAVAGAEREVCAVRVQRLVRKSWAFLTLHGEPIDWIPSPVQTRAILATPRKLEVEPERPSEEVLAGQANRLNEILRECEIKDEYRPVYVATFMLALWLGDVSVDPDVVLTQVNSNAKRALERARKPELSRSLRVDEENEHLAERAWEIIDILKKLNIRSFMQEHDYLGQLYETFFRYTGGNTIGQYFTPRHIVALVCELVEVTPKDVVFDPACGTGGFLIGALNRMIKKQKLTYQDAVQKVRSNLFGMESEPATAALCVTNMILRGDGTSGVVRKDCFKRRDYPPSPADISMLNPPFPHKKTDTPATDFIDRAIQSVRNKGLICEHCALFLF
jgi:hypothetical protein